jgi:hypothetical protein
MEDPPHGAATHACRGSRGVVTGRDCLRTTSTA